MQTVLALLGFIDGQEQDPWKTIWPWLNLKDRWVVADDDPPERFAPPPTQRTRVRRGENDLLPLKAHDTTTDAALPGCLTITPWQATDRRYLAEGSMALIDAPTKEVTTSPTANELTAA